jgi:DNA-binding LacI/PurR family transcriptional regulator
MTSSRNPAGRPTMRQVAELAGVSVQTVSNHVNGRYQYMAEDTRRRVAAAMRELGYHPNVTARSLRSAETRTLGFLILDQHARFLADPLTDLVIAGVGDVAREQDYGILIQAARPAEEPEGLLAPLLQSRVDGAFLLLSGEPKVREEIIGRVGEMTRQFVVFDEPLTGQETMSVRAADRDGGRRLAEHLLERGHERIALMGAAVPWAVVEQRTLGFNDAMRSRGIEPDPDLIKLEAGWEPASAVPIAERLLELTPRPTAIVCLTDLLGIATIHTAHRLGLDVPGDVAVCGFDDFPFSQFTHPALTTVRVPAYEMGAEAARILIGHLGGDEDVQKQVELAVELMVRAST